MVKREEGRYGKRGPGEGHAYGIASVSNALGGVDFPMSKQDLINKYGDRRIEWTKGNPEPLKEVLHHTIDNEFNSMADVVSAVSKSHKKIR